MSIVSHNPYINSIVILIDPRIDPEIPDLPGPNLNYPDPDPGFIFPEKWMVEFLEFE